MKYAFAAWRKRLRHIRCKHPDWINHYLGVHECTVCGKITIAPGPR